MKRVTLALLFAATAAGAQTQWSFGNVAAGRWNLFLSNHGGIGRDSLLHGGTWPRGTIDETSYIHDGGFWFGCVRSSDTTRALVEMSYVPKFLALRDTTHTAFTPLLRNGVEESVYDSRDYNADGSPKTAGLPPWCIRNVKGGALLKDGNSGEFVADSAARVAKPAAFIADQQLVAATSDSAFASGSSYPIGLTAVTTLYAWNSDSLKNCVLAKLSLRNVSTDTLLGCYLAPVFGLAIGADSTNDECTAYTNDSLNMFLGSSSFEPPLRLGRIGVSVVNPPRGALFAGAYAWAIEQEATNDRQRYDFLANVNSGAGLGATVRGLASCGPFTLEPGAQANMVYVIVAGLDTANADNRDSSFIRIVRAIRAVRNYWFSFNDPSGVGSERVVGAPSLAVYPNPVSSTASVSVPQAIAGSVVHLSLVDALGRVVLSGDRVCNESGMIEFDANRLPAGVYRAAISLNHRVHGATVAIVH